MKKARNIFIIALTACAVLCLISCESMLVSEPFENTITGNYNAFCSEYRMSYGAFEAKGLNWDSLTVAYGAGLSDSSPEDLLYERICGLLNEVNDGHADISGLDHGYYRSWNRRNMSYFGDLETQDMTYVDSMRHRVMTDYLNDNFMFIDVSGWTFFFGKIDHAGSEIGYMCIPTFGVGDFPYDFIQSAVDSMNTLDGVIMDLRYNGGGTTESFVWCLNTFVCEETLYLKSAFRNSPVINTSTYLKEHWIRPHDDYFGR